MNTYWQNYWILYQCDKWAIQLKNNWHKYSDSEFHVLSIYRKWLNDKYDYYFCLLGFQIRFIDYSKIERK
jgi:hypothetical protein